MPDKAVRHMAWQKTAIAAGISLLVLAAGATAVVSRQSHQSAQLADSADMAAASPEIFLDDADETVDAADVAVQETEDVFEKGEEAINSVGSGQMNGIGALIPDSIYYRLTIRVIGMENTGEELVYEAEVLKSDSEAIDAGSRITFRIGEDFGDVPADGQTYTVTLEDASPALSIEHPYILRELEE